MTNKKEPFTLVDKKILHLNKSLGQIETNSNNEVIYNLRDHIRLNRGDQVSLYKSFVNERGLNAQTISLQQDYDTEWKFLYSIPADPKRIIGPSSFIFQEYLPYHPFSNYLYNIVGATGQPLILFKLSISIIATQAAGGIDFIIEPVIGNRKIFVPADNYSVTSLGSLITDQLQGSRLPYNEESDYIQEKIMTEGGFTSNFYDNQMSFAISIIDFNRFETVGLNFDQKAYNALINDEDPEITSRYLSNFLGGALLKQTDVAYLFADMNVYDLFISKKQNRENLYFYRDLHTAAAIPLPKHLFYLPLQYPPYPAQSSDIIYGRPSYYAIGAKSCALNFDLEENSRFFIDKLHQPCLFPNQSLSDGSYPLTLTQQAGESPNQGNEFTKFYFNSQNLVHGILPVDNTSAVQVLDFCTELSTSLSNKRSFFFNCCFFFIGSEVLYIVSGSRVVPFVFNQNYDPALNPIVGYFRQPVSINKLFSVIPEGTEIRASFKTANNYLYLFSDINEWRYNFTTNTWDIVEQLLDNDSHFENSPVPISYCVTLPNGNSYVFSDRFYKLFPAVGIPSNGQISALNLGFNPTKYFTASPVINYTDPDGTTYTNCNLFFHGDMFDVVQNNNQLIFTNIPTPSYFTGLVNGSDAFSAFQQFPPVSKYWSFDQFFSNTEIARQAFNQSLMYRLGFSYEQLGDIQNIITRVKFPILNSGTSNNLKGITTRQQASLGLQLGASGLGFADEFKNSAGVTTPYNFLDVVGPYNNPELSINIDLENNGTNILSIQCKPGQRFDSASPEYALILFSVTNGDFFISYTDTNGVAQVWLPTEFIEEGSYTFSLQSSGDTWTTLLATPASGGLGPFFPNMINPILNIDITQPKTPINFTSVKILTNSRPLDCQNLPDLLGENNFYLIYSNLVNNNFYSANQGDKAGGIVGICSLQFAANDTLFNTESIPFTINQTTILDQIIVRITNPDGSSPNSSIIDKNSAFIFIIETVVSPSS
jgi:hypothetical protein